MLNGVARSASTSVSRRAICIHLKSPSCTLPQVAVKRVAEKHREDCKHVCFAYWTSVVYYMLLRCVYRKNLPLLVDALVFFSLIYVYKNGLQNLRPANCMFFFFFKSSHSHVFMKHCRTAHLHISPYAVPGVLKSPSLTLQLPRRDSVSPFSIFVHSDVHAN